MKILYVIIICVLLFSCSDNNLPKDILPPAKMEILLWEQMRADAFTKEFISKDSTKNLANENNKLQQKIFAKYKVEEAVFYDSYAYYLKHGELIAPLLDSIIAKQTIIKQAEFEKKVGGQRLANAVDPFNLQLVIRPKRAFDFKIDLNTRKIVDSTVILKLPDTLKQNLLYKNRSNLRMKPTLGMPQS
jgi:hypothetical protein